MPAAGCDHEHSIGAALTTGCKQLVRVSDTPLLDAQLLLAHTLDKPRSYLFGHPERVVPPAAQRRYHQLIAKRGQGEPIAYLLGEQGFWSLDLTVSNAVLVPRPETELLVETALTHLPANKPTTLADLGTGSGAVALAIASERPDCRVLATDVSPAALVVARGNARRLDLARVKFRLGDWFAAVAGQYFGLIVANPPYVAPADPHLANLRFEPQTALVAGDDGRACLQHLVEHAPRYLLPEGWLLLEHGMDQGAYVRARMLARGYTSIHTEPDLAGHPRVTLGQHAGSRP